MLMFFFMFNISSFLNVLKNVLGYVNSNDDIKGNIPFYNFESIMGISLSNLRHTSNKIFQKNIPYTMNEP